MNINTTTRRQAQDIVRQNDTVGADYDELWCDFLEPGIFVGKVFWLDDRKFLTNREAFDWIVN